MWPNLKMWLAAAGSILLTILTLGGWALMERKTRQYHQRRAERAERTADIHRTLARVAEASEKEKKEVEEATEKALSDIQMARDKAYEKRQELRRTIEDNPIPAVEWFNRYFGDRK